MTVLVEVARRVSGMVVVFAWFFFRHGIPLQG